MKPHPALSILIPLIFGLQAGAQVIINEIHYDPADETSNEEFIELHNAGASSVDLSGWSLDKAVDFTFPGGITIPAGGYLVIAEDPATLSSVYGVTALGPWTKGLSNDGETVELLDGSQTLIDEVSYQSGFPWPTGARGGGGSIELIHPGLDNDLAGSWRTSGSPPVPPTPTIYVPESSTNWHYRKGTSEASNPVDAWRSTVFSEDSSWVTGQASIGYGDSDDNTVLNDMRYTYSTVYLRHTFTVSPLDIPQAVKLRIYTDDGAIVWINGIEVDRFHSNTGQIPYNGFGINHDAEWEEITIPNAASYINGGTNVIAVHGLNTSLTSSDFSIDLELKTPDAGDVDGVPTPGAVNSSFSVEAPPQIRQVAHTPNSPTSGAPVLVTAKITDPDGVSSVTLHYQAVDPGSYIRRTDTAYNTDWTPVTMVDDGTGGDSIAGDDVYSVTLPGSLQTHRRLMRYRIETEDTNTHSITVPYSDDKQPNFAYYVYDTLPSWAGSFSPSDSTETFSSDLMDDLPVYQLVANNTDVINSQYSSGSDGIHMPGTLIYDGKVYDHVEFENRGEFSTYVSGKNKWRFHFNRARRFQARDDWGKKYGSTWSKLNLQGCASPWAAVNRGMAGLDETVSFRLYDLAGLPSPRTHYLSFRVVDSTNQTNPSDQYDSDLWGLYVAVEQMNGSFLDDRNLEDGNIYKIEGGNGDKKEQGNTQVVDSSDWSSFYSSSNNNQSHSWWRTHMDMPKYYSLRAMNRFTGNVDIRHGYNHYFYHEPTQDLWVPMPWDLDMMFIAETHQAGVIRQQNSINHNPELALEFRNRCREISDLMASDASLAGGQIGQLVDEYAQIVNPTGQSKTWADVDASMWNYHPRTRGSVGNHSGQTNHKGNFYYSPFTDSRGGGTYVRTLASNDHEGFVKHLIDYMTDTYPGGSWSPGNGVPAGYGFEYLNYEANDALIPNTPTLSFIGDPGFPTNGLSFASIDFSDPNGPGTFSKMRWRIAELSAPGVGSYEVGARRIYEIETLHLAEFSTFNAGYTIPTEVTTPGHTYRVRVQHEDTSGRTSHWSAPIQFTVTGADVIQLTDNLVVSEFMYHPADPTGDELLVSTNDSDFEFLELQNVSDTLTLDLSGLSFTTGIAFDFSTAAINSLAPGERLVVVNDLAAFEARYGTGRPVAGEFTSNLSNGGEQLILAFGGTTPVIDFTYDDLSPWPTEPDTAGVSLILVDPESVPDHTLAVNWMAGAGVNGTPGTSESPTFASWQADEFTAPELADPNISGPDADPDGDGFGNLLEFALGLSPKVADATGVVVGAVIDDGGSDYLSLTFPRLVSRDNLTYVVETSPDLGAWTPTTGVEVSLVDNGDGTETVTIRSDTPLTPGGREFIRLEVTEGGTP